MKQKKRRPMLSLTNESKACLINLIKNIPLNKEVFTVDVKNELLNTGLIELNTQTNEWFATDKAASMFISNEIRVYYPLPSDKNSILGGTASNLSLSIKYGNNKYIALLLNALKNELVFARLSDKEVDKMLLHLINYAPRCSKSTINILFKKVNGLLKHKRLDLPLDKQISIVESEILELQQTLETLKSKKI